MTRRGAPSVMMTRAAMMLSAWLLLGGAAMDARAQGGTLEAPMHPIGKTDAAPSRCAKCPAAEAQELETQRVSERTAPEYPGARGAGPELEPAESTGAGLVSGPFSVALPPR